MRLVNKRYLEEREKNKESKKYTHANMVKVGARELDICLGKKNNLDL